MGRPGARTAHGRHGAPRAGAGLLWGALRPEKNSGRLARPCSDVLDPSKVRACVVRSDCVPASLLRDLPSWCAEARDWSGGGGGRWVRGGGAAAGPRSGRHPRGGRRGGGRARPHRQGLPPLSGRWAASRHVVRAFRETFFGTFFARGKDAGMIDNGQGSCIRTTWCVAARGAATGFEAAEDKGGCSSPAGEDARGLFRASSRTGTPRHPPPPRAHPEAQVCALSACQTRALQSRRVNVVESSGRVSACLGAAHGLRAGVEGAGGDGWRTSTEAPRAKESGSGPRKGLAFPVHPLFPASSERVPLSRSRSFEGLSRSVRLQARWRREKKVQAGERSGSPAPS